MSPAKGSADFIDCLTKGTLPVFADELKGKFRLLSIGIESVNVACAAYQRTALGNLGNFSPELKAMCSMLTGSLNEYDTSLLPSIFGTFGLSALRRCCRAADVARSRDLRSAFFSTRKVLFISRSWLYNSGIFRSGDASLFLLDLEGPFSKGHPRLHHDSRSQAAWFDEPNEPGEFHFSGGDDDNEYLSFAAQAIKLCKVVSRSEDSATTVCMVVACPTYNSNGVQVHSFVLISVYEYLGGDTEVCCSCEHCIKCSSKASASDLFDDTRSCYGVRLVKSHLGQISREELFLDKSHHIILNDSPESVVCFIRTVNDRGILSDGSICVIGKNQVQCHNCHCGKPQDPLDGKLCREAEYIKIFSEEEHAEESLNCVAEKWNVLLNGEHNESASSLTFNNETSRWELDSLSSKLETDLYEKNGVARNFTFPKRATDFPLLPHRRAAYMGGPGDPTVGNRDADPTCVLEFYPSLPGDSTADKDKGCVYYDEEVFSSFVVCTRYALSQFELCT